MRSAISVAALLVKVIAQIFCGGIPSSIKYRIRLVSVLVFPVPAPATIKRGPVGACTARSWASFNRMELLFWGICGFSGVLVLYTHWLFFKKMKKDNLPLIVAVFLATGGLLSGVSALGNKTGITEVASTRRSAEFFISTAQGAQNAATLFGAQTLSPVTAVSGNGALNSKSVFSVSLGAVKDSGSSFGLKQAQVSSLSR